MIHLLGASLTLHRPKLNPDEFLVPSRRPFANDDGGAFQGMHSGGKSMTRPSRRYALALCIGSGTPRTPQKIARVIDTLGCTTEVTDATNALQAA